MGKTINVLTDPVDLKNNYEAYRESIRENDYKAVEDLIMLNNVPLVSIILLREDFSHIFQPGFRREGDRESRMISQYLFMTMTREMKEILLSNSGILDTVYRYHNEYVNFC